MSRISITINIVAVFIISLVRTGLPMGPNRGRCGTGEWSCLGLDQGLKCISLSRFCDGISNCPDGSDEPPGCTNCNKTYSGKSGVKYPLRVTGPFQRYLPFVCQISFVAMGGDFGDSVELSFLSFQIGTFELKRDLSSACRKGFMKIFEPIPSSTEDPESQTVFGDFCGRLPERSATFYSKSSNVTLLIVVPSRASIPSTNSFTLFLTFRFLNKNPSLSWKSPGVNQFGNPIPGTFCDRMFLNCHFRPCKIRSPNFPGFYPRNITCNYYIKQMLIPHANMAYVILHQSNDYKILIPKAGESTSSTSASNLRSNSLLSSDCSGLLSDALKVYDGSSTSMPLLAHLCGEGTMPKIVSSGSELLVQLYSAPYNILCNSRLEIQISVKFEAETSAAMQRDRHRCAYIIDASRHRRWGIITSPKYTMPENSSCTYKFIGASSYDRIWLYFVSYVSREKISTSKEDMNDKVCKYSKLEMFDSEDRWSVLDLHDGFESFPTEFCGETVIPRMCVHAADYPPHFTPGRPCRYPDESYLSSGPTFVLRHKFLATLEAVDIFSYSAFTAKYEFVDTRQDGIAIGRTECDRRFDSRTAKGGFISNPKNVFLYGRGGRENISCAFHFVGLPSERVRITIFIAKLSMTTSDVKCETHLDPITHRYLCQTPSETQIGRMAFLRGIEYWESHSATIGCLCNVTSTDKTSKYIFDSLVSNVKFIFAVNFMTPFEDFTDFNFEAKFEFFNSTLCDTHVFDDRSGFSPEGTIEFHVPHGRTNFTSGEDISRPLRCRWQIQAMTEKYLYVNVNGLTNPTRNCEEGIWTMMYLTSYQVKPTTSVCVVSEPKTKSKDYHVFSQSWYNESYVIDDLRDSIFIEIVSMSNWKGIKLQFHWMEVTKPFYRSLSGRPLRNIDCIFECPEIGACIDPHLWCDGVEHCPSGFDESSANCHSFGKGLEYLSLIVTLAALFLLIAGIVVAWAIVRHRHIHQTCEDEQDERSKDCRHRLTPTEDYQMESPIS